jgi:hypothetical protein
MDAAAVSSPKRTQRLLEHCLALGSDGAQRPTAEARLEALLGPDLARRLVRALSARSAG